ncbi:MAG: MerR family transcriptional regulator [Lachnospiraceae bacterium]|nr:MerR family transcriptional regulator [Lachnospiraceae bacterium]
MSEYHYQISEASRLLAVEAHVLRYWEEELGMIIPRNEMGHRYYTEEHLRIFSQIKDMKERGYQLRAIRAILSGEEPPETPITEIPLRREQREISAPGPARIQTPTRVPGDAPAENPSTDPSEAPATGPAVLPEPAPVEIPGTAPDRAPKEPSARISEVQAQNAAEWVQNPSEQMGNLSEQMFDSKEQIRTPKVQIWNPAGQTAPAASAADAEEREKRMNQFQEVVTRIVAQAMICNNPGLAKDISSRVEKDLIMEIERMMNSSESRQEERFRKLDESIRAIQQGNRARYEAAAARSPGLFGRKRRRKKYRRF